MGRQPIFSTICDFGWRSQCIVHRQPDAYLESVLMTESEFVEDLDQLFELFDMPRACVMPAEVGV